VPRKRREHCAQQERVYRFSVPTVLIVEDNRALAYAVAEVLRSIGYGTLIAHDGEAALSEAERSKPEVAIVDLELPAIDGLEVARRLREGYGKQIRLIANTALASTMCSSSRPRSIRLSRPFSTAENNLPSNGSLTQDPAVQCRTGA